jgi:hypothetical protein
MMRQKEAGQALIFAVSALGIALMGFAGLGIDMGVMRYEKRLSQNAADGAAIAGADELRYNGGAGISGAVSDAATSNGFSGITVQNNTACPTTVTTATLTVNNPPQTGPHAADANYVEVCVAQLQSTYFMRVLGITHQTVSARAVATLAGESGPAPGCLFTLGPPGTGIGVGTSGTPSLQATSCGIEDSGNFTTNGNKVNIAAGSIGVVGNDTNNGGGTVTCGGSTSNCPVTGMPPTGDPLSYITPPCTGTGCQGPDIKISGGKCTGAGCSNVTCNGGTCTISPGAYGQISIDNNQTVVFSSGTYSVDGNFTVNAGTTETGSGVTFYITGGGALTINGGATSQFSAPTTGPYAGILFYQDPTDSSSAKIDGTSSSYFEGALYFPSAQLTFGGSSTFTNDQAAYTIIVVQDLKLAGTSTVNLKSDYSSLPGGNSIIKNAVLVE